MGPPGPREALEAAIREVGCEIRGDPFRDDWINVDCPDPEKRASLVDIGAWIDARYDGRIRMLGLSLLPRGRTLSALEIAAAIQRAVAERVRFIDEAGDQIQSAWITWSYAAGDCDCQTRLVLALLRALGLPAVPVGWRREDGVAHICAALERPSGPVLLETTLGPSVGLGESPIAAARRLRAGRGDLTSSRTMGELPPIEVEPGAGTWFIVGGLVLVGVLAWRLL